MDCSEFDSLIHDLGRRGMVPADVREMALAHAESCSQCATLLTQAESLEFRLRLLGSQDANLEAPALVAKVLRSEFRRQKSVASKRKAHSRFAAIGVAAAVLLALGLLVRDWQSIVKGSKEKITATQTPSVPAASSTTMAAPEPASRTQPGSPDEQPRSINSGRTESVAADSAGEFVRLPYADDPSMLEGGAIVRVQISRSALASFGFPISGFADSELIPADVVVSEDGTPQAIRLVSETVSSE